LCLPCAILEVLNVMPVAFVIAVIGSAILGKALWSSPNFIKLDLQLSYADVGQY